MAVAFGTSGAAANAAASPLSVAYPSSIAAGDLLVLTVVTKFNPNNPTTPSGWTLQGQVSGGSGADGADVGTIITSVYTKEATGSESGSLSVTLHGSNNVSLGRMHRYTKTSGAVWSLAATTGSDNSAGTSWSVTGAANPGITANDMMLAVSGVNTDAYTYSSEAMTATGISTWGTMAERGDDTTTTGSDVALVTSEHPVTTGTASAAPVFTMTASGTTTNRPAGSTVILRLRQNSLPTVALDSPTDAGSISDSTPDLVFTGTDSDADTLEYLVQVDTALTFGQVVDSYSESNSGSTGALSSTFPAQGQSFVGNGGVLGSAHFYIYRSGTVIGNLVAKVFAHSGTLGSSSVPTGAALATSEARRADAIPSGSGNIALQEFFFTGANQITLTNGTNYVVVIEVSVPGDASNNIQVGRDSTSSTHAGNAAFYNGSSWSAQSSIDLCFYVITKPLLGKLSVSDSGFVDTTNGADTHPFASGDQITFTVQAGDALTDGTYYWRVAATDPTGSGLYAWSSVRSFSLSSGATLVTQDIANALTLDATTITQNHVISPADISLALTEDADTITVIEKIEALTDDFDDNSLDTAKWSDWSSGNVSETGTQLEIDHPNLALYYGMDSVDNYTLDESRVFVELVDPGAHTTQANYEAYPLTLELDSDNKLYWMVSDGFIRAWKIVATTYTQVYSAALGASEGIWVQIRETSGTTYWETSTTGAAGSWTTRHSESTPIDHTNLKVVIMTGAWASPGGTTTMVVDNFNIEPVTNHTIVTQDIAISLTEDATTISQLHIIATQDALLSLTSDNTTISQNHVIALADIALSLTADVETLTYNYTVAPNDVALALTVDATTISQAHVLTLQDVAIVLTTDNTTITQLHVIAPQDASLALTADNTTVSQNHVLAPSDVLTSLTADNTTITQTNFVITVQDAAIALSLDNTAIAQNHIVVSADVNISTTEDNTTISQLHVVVPADITTALSEDNTTVEIGDITLSVADVAVALTEDATTITQTHVIALQDLAVAVTEDATTISQLHSLSPQDVALQLAADNTTISQTQVVSTQDLALSLTEDNTTISQVHSIATQDAAIALSADNTTIVELYTVLTQDVAIGLTEDATTISQNQIVASADVSIGLTEDNTTLVQTHLITAADVALALTEDATTIAIESVTIISTDLALALATDTGTLTQNHLIELQDLVLGLALDTNRVAMQFVATTPGADGDYTPSTSDAPGDFIAASAGASSTFVPASSSSGDFVPAPSSSPGTFTPSS